MLFADPNELLSLARAMAAPENDLCILAEGNVSARAGEDSFWVKGSGQAMGAMGVDGFSLVRLRQVCEAVDGDFADDGAIRQALNDACVEGPSPSTETFMHASLLQLPGVSFVGHTHPTPLLSLLCLSDARDYATRRLFPDEIVCCGPAACFVPYVAPGLELARSIRRETAAFLVKHGITPKTFWLENHGLIAVGATAKEVESACLMSVKAARVLLSALQSGRTVKWLTVEEVAHIYNWPDEHARQKALWG
ncbi:MAG TPA: class II aldolase/adducin family protein [Fimbriimonadaceae bacterium]|nr:class II aldolase/adducin family protein [Fimbriimonadaceae bacterium]